MKKLIYLLAFSLALLLTSGQVDAQQRLFDNDTVSNYGATITSNTITLAGAYPVFITSLWQCDSISGTSLDITVSIEHSLDGNIWYLLPTFTANDATVGLQAVFNLSNTKATTVLTKYLRAKVVTTGTNKIDVTCDIMYFKDKY